MFKRALNVDLTVNASDAEGIDDSTYKATVTRRRIAPNGIDDPVGTPALLFQLDIFDTGDGSGANDMAVDISGSDSRRRLGDFDVAFRGC